MRASAATTRPLPDGHRDGGPPLLSRRLCFVIGKGGVGKSTVAAALGMSVARTGRRTLVVEVPAGEHRSALFARAHVRHGHETEIAPNLWGLSIDVERATEEYLASQLRVRAMVELLAKSHAFHHFTAAAPGLAELVTIGKIWSLAVALRPDGRAPVWDYLVVDCPATGHGLALLEMAGNVGDLAASGPIRDQAERINQVVTHPAATGIVVVARPDELPVTEAIETAATLRNRGLPVALAVMNGMRPSRFTPEEARVVRAAAERLADAPAAPALRAAAEAAVAELDRVDEGAAQAARLADGAALPVVELPEIDHRRFDLVAVRALSDALDAVPEPALRGPAAG
ncbi:MAG: ArsA family ATPase [Actinomycetota bacterium]